MSVYFISCENTDMVKVGWANDVKKRLSQHQTGCPFDLRLEGHLEGSRTEEMATHAALAGYRVRYEWFEREAALRFLSEAREGGLKATAARWVSENEAKLLACAKECAEIRRVARPTFDEALMEAAAEHGMDKLKRVAGIRGRMPKRPELHHLLNLMIFLGPEFASKLLGLSGLRAVALKTQPDLFDGRRVA